MIYRRLIYVAVAVSLAVWTLPVRAETDSVTIQRTLDTGVVDLQITDMLIGEVFRKFQEVTGARFVIDDETLKCLPYGDQTRLSVTIKDITLRKALTPMLLQQALRWEIDGETIHIRPTESLCRICRRATYDELSILGKIYSVKLKPTAEAGPVIDQLRKITGREDLQLIFHMKADRDAAFERAERALGGPASDWLDALCHSQDWTWVLLGEKILVIDKVRQLKRQLAQKVSLQYRNANLIDVLLDLGRKGRFKLSISPGVMSLLPVNIQENFNLVMADASIDQAMEVISGATGLLFVPTSDGMRIDASKNLTEQLASYRGRARKRARFFVLMNIPGPGGTQIQIFMRPEELPEDVLKSIEKSKQQFIETLRGERSPEETQESQDAK